MTLGYWVVLMYVVAFSAIAAIVLGLRTKRRIDQRESRRRRRAERVAAGLSDY